MASRRDYYFRQLVTEAELDAGFNGLEAADHAIMSDMSLVGVHQLAVVGQHAGTPNLTVDVSAPGIVYDQTGQRVTIPSLQNVNVAVDDSAVATTVATPGNEKWVSVFVKFTRSLSDVRVDGNSNSVYFVRDESFIFSVLQGAEAAIGVATKPALLSDGILLADVHRTNGQTQVLTADINSGTSRRQDCFVVSGTPRALRRGLIKDSFSDLLGYYNNHVTAAADRHAATAIDYAGGGTWANGTTNPATTVELQLDKLVSDLAATADPSGLKKVGCQARTNWLDGTTNVAVTGFAALDKIITDLALTTSNASGAHKVGLDALPNWLDGLTNPALNVGDALEKIITDLSDQVGTTADGASRIGSSGYSGHITLTSGSVRSQLKELSDGAGGLGATNTWTGINNFNNQIVAGSGVHFQMSSRTITRVQTSPLLDGVNGIVNPAAANVDPAGASVWYQDVLVPDGVTIIGVTAYVNPADDALPTTNVSLRLKRVDLTTGVISTISNTVDPNTGGAYQAHHAFGPNVSPTAAISEAVDRTKYKYYTQMDAENGGDVDPATWYGCSITYTTTAVDDGY